MSWPLFMDQSGQDHKSMPYEVSGGVARHASPILEAIVADITNYADRGAHVFFAIYNPKQCVDEESDFAEPVRKREQMFVESIRKGKFA